MPHVDRTTVVEMLAALDEGYADILGLLDRNAAIQRIVDRLPSLTGADIAWVGDLDTADKIVLGHPVNTATNVIEGLVVPEGTGLGWQVLTARRPVWVGNYCASPQIAHPFRAQAEAEGVKAMIAVPIINNGNLSGVLYAANRTESDFGDRVAANMELLASRIAAAEVVAERARHAAEVAVHEERRRLSMELHDTVGAMLYTLGAGIRRLGAEPGLDESVRERLSTIGEQTAEATAALRGSLRMLGATPDQVALGVALREHCRAFKERSGIPARFITLTDLPALSDARGRMLSDSAREALLNVEKHARAESVVVTVCVLRQGVAVTVADDGVGCSSSEMDTGGLGLAAMTDRLARVGGTVTLGRNDDGGLTVQIWVPK